MPFPTTVSPSLRVLLVGGALLLGAGCRTGDSCEGYVFCDEVSATHHVMAETDGRETGVYVEEYGQHRRILEPRVTRYGSDAKYVYVEQHGGRDVASGYYIIRIRDSFIDGPYAPAAFPYVDRLDRQPYAYRDAR